MPKPKKPKIKPISNNLQDINTHPTQAETSSATIQNPQNEQRVSIKRQVFTAAQLFGAAQKFKKTNKVERLAPAAARVVKVEEPSRLDPKKVNADGLGFLLHSLSGKGKLKEAYENKRTEKGLKGVFQSLHVVLQHLNITSGIRTISNKRDKQIQDLESVINKLIADKDLNSHERGIILFGALQVVIDNIARAEKKNAFQARLATLCRDLQRVLAKPIGVDPKGLDAAKILYHAYDSAKGSKAAIEQFRKMVGQLQSQLYPEKPTKKPSR